MTPPSGTRRAGASRRPPTTLALTLALTLAACGTQPSRFYQLTAAEGGAAGAGGSVAAASRLVIGLDSVGLPDYLDRSEMVLRGAGSRLVVLEFDRWGGPIGSMATAVLARNLGAMLETAEVVTLPVARDVPLSQVVEVRLDRFDADEAGPAVLDARWRIFDRHGERLSRFGRTVAREPVAAPGDPGAVADALSRLLARLAGDIAGALRPGTGRVSGS